jgi:hypothetical protein
MPEMTKRTRTSLRISPETQLTAIEVARLLRIDTGDEWSVAEVMRRALELGLREMRGRIEKKEAKNAR